MHFKRLLAGCTAAMLCAVSVGSTAASAEVFDGSAIEFADFGEKFADKFLSEGQVEKGEMSYKSHDLNLTVTRNTYDRMTGDLDESGAVTVADAVLLTQYLTEHSAELSETAMFNADINEDDMVTAQDLSKMLRWLNGTVADADFFIEHTLVYFVVDFYVRSVENFRSAFAQGEYHDLTMGKKDDTVMNMAKENNAVFAINGDFISYRNDGITWRNGIFYRDAGRYCKRGYLEDVEVLFDNGEMNIVSDAEYRAMSDEEKSHIWQTVTFSPTLLRDGEIVPTHQTGNILNRHPRTGVGYFEPGHYCFVLAEGRQPGYSNGVRIWEFAQIFKDLGCVNAFNSDGGASSVMALYGTQVNQPAWRGRATDDIFYLVDTADIVPDAAAEKWIAQQTAE